MSLVQWRILAGIFHLNAIIDIAYETAIPLFFVSIRFVLISKLGLQAHRFKDLKLRTNQEIHSNNLLINTILTDQILNRLIGTERMAKAKNSPNSRPKAFNLSKEAVKEYKAHHGNARDAEHFLTPSPLAKTTPKRKRRDEAKNLWDKALKKDVRYCSPIRMLSCGSCT